MAINALFGNLKRFRANDRSLPLCTFTDPEAGRVGLFEEEARDQGIPFEVTRFDFRELDPGPCRIVFFRICQGPDCTRQGPYSGSDHYWRTRRRSPVGIHLGHKAWTGTGKDRVYSPCLSHVAGSRKVGCRRLEECPRAGGTSRMGPAVSCAPAKDIDGAMANTESERDPGAFGSRNEGDRPDNDGRTGG